MSHNHCDPMQLENSPTTTLSHTQQSSKPTDANRLVSYIIKTTFNPLGNNPSIIFPVYPKQTITAEGDYPDHPSAPKHIPVYGDPQKHNLKLTQ